MGENFWFFASAQLKKALQATSDFLLLRVFCDNPFYHVCDTAYIFFDVYFWFRGHTGGFESNRQRILRTYVRWEAIPIVACCVFALSFASYRFYCMAKEPNSHWTRSIREKSEDHWQKIIHGSNPNTSSPKADH